MNYIRQLNFKVNAGIIRAIDVSAGGTGRKPVIPDELNAEEHIANILNSDEPLTKKAIDLMLYIMRCRLFIDGNKRTAQILANKIMIENSCGIISVPADLHKDFCGKLTEYRETNNSENISEFIYSECITGAKMI